MYALLTSDGTIKSVFVKVNPLLRLKVGESVVPYSFPDVDLNLYNVEPIYPIGDSVEFSVTRKSEADDLEKLDMLRRIDKDVDEVYSLAIGNRGTEYTQAEADALKYRANNYTGGVPTFVKDYADSAAISTRQSADGIIATANLWKSVQGQLREARLKAKAEVRAGMVEQVQQTWPKLISTIKSQLGV